MKKLNIARYSRKEVLSSFPETPAGAAAWLSAAVKAAGSLRIERHGPRLVFESGDRDYAESVVRCVRTLYGCPASIETAKAGSGVVRGKRHSVTLTAGITDSVLRDTGMLNGGNGFTATIPEKFTRDRDLAVNYLKSLFAACGRVGVPVKIMGEDREIESSGKGYWLEFPVPDEVYAGSLCRLLGAFGINARTAGRGNGYVVYVKESGAISDFFALLSCSETVLYIQDIMVERMVNGDVNRRSNCDAANMDRTAIAGTRQILALKTIAEHGASSLLDDGLRELAELRLEHPMESLRFFAEKTGLSKSGVNHRFRRLSAIAERLEREGEEKA